MLYPSLKKCEKLAGAFNRIPLYRELNISEPGMLMLVKSLQGERHVAFLESARRDRRPGRYSFLGLSPRKIIRYMSPGFIETEGIIMQRINRNIFDYLKDEIGSVHSPTYQRYGDFNGGFVGYMGFELVNHTGIMRHPVRENAERPLAMFQLIDDFIVCDNTRNRYHLATAIYPDGETSLEEHYRRAAERLDETERSIIARIGSTTLPYLPARAESNMMRFRISPERFMKNVAETVRLIREGEALQVVLSMRADITGPVDPFTFYLRLRQLNPSPYMFYLTFDELTIAGSSPEIHVKVKNDTAILKPIAGTIRQEGTRAGNMKNKAALLSDPKERAEHLMLVDLARNDLARISHAGSVRVSRFMEPEDYSHVIHLVSLVEGGVKPGLDAVDVLRETFPAGTVSGAPKVRALEIIDGMEEHAREIYGGAVGYIGFNGQSDTCITIRTAVFSPEESYLHAGAGIVYDSVPESELREIHHKLGALAASLPYGRITEREEAGACFA